MDMREGDNGVAIIEQFLNCRMRDLRNPECHENILPRKWSKCLSLVFNVRFVSDTTIAFRERESQMCGGDNFENVAGMKDVW